MKPGTMIRLPDGREGTVVYHGLDGYGIILGRVIVDVEAIYGQPFISDKRNAGVPVPTAMLRDCGAEMNAKLWPGMECVGEEYEVLGDAEHFTECGECGHPIDMRDLAEVFAHEGPHERPARH